MARRSSSRESAPTAAPQLGTEHFRIDESGGRRARRELPPASPGPSVRRSGLHRRRPLTVRQRDRCRRGCRPLTVAGRSHSSTSGCRPLTVAGRRHSSTGGRRPLTISRRHSRSSGRRPLTISRPHSSGGRRRPLAVGRHRGGARGGPLAAPGGRLHGNRLGGRQHRRNGYSATENGGYGELPGDLANSGIANVSRHDSSRM